MNSKSQWNIDFGGDRVVQQGNGLDVSVLQRNPGQDPYGATRIRGKWRARAAIACADIRTADNEPYSAGNGGVFAFYAISKIPNSELRQAGQEVWDEIGALLRSAPCTTPCIV